MSLRVQQLNADTTFLITFLPPFAPAKLSKRFPGDFTILLDPWLRGDASMLHPSFMTSRHLSTPALHSLKDLPQYPDVIVVSQDRPDHCHRETLCSFPRHSDTSILATPSAAKRIRSWGHFDKEHVHAIELYNPLDDDSIIRIPIPGYSSNSAEGEITIAYIPAKRDLAGVHSAICITYQPPSSVLTVNRQSWRRTNSSTVVLSDRGISSTRPSSSDHSRPPSAPRPAFLDPLGLTASNTDSHSLSSTSSPSSRVDSGVSSVPQPQSNQEQVLSVIYTPHGVTTPTLQPYMQHHLVPLDALPISALIHGLNVADNPWFLGGNVATGTPGGLRIAKRFGVQHWIRAHDDKHKVVKGMATLLVKSRPYALHEARTLLRNAGLTATKVHELEMGGALRIPELKDAVEKGDCVLQGAGKGLSLGKGQRMNVETNVLAMPEPDPERPVTAPAVVAPGTKIRIRREITHPDGMWI